MAVKLIALDIDGTLLDSRWTLPEANRAAIAEATRRGIEVALVTGRRYDSPCPLLCSSAPAYHDREQWSSDSNARRADAPAAFAAAENSGPRSRNCPSVARQHAVIFDRAQPNVILEIFATDDPIRSAYYARNKEFIAKRFHWKAASRKIRCK